MEIQNDNPIEVTQEQYRFLTTAYEGFIAHREHEGKLYIKLWFKKLYGTEIKNYLTVKPKRELL